MGISMRFVFCLALLSLSVLGCERRVSNEFSALKIKLPNHSSKVGALTSFPGGYRYCYGVSVTAPDIPGFAGDSCAPQTGLISGFKESGETLDIQVPKGSGRKVDLYVYTIPSGDSSTPCPGMSANLGGSSSLTTYLVGSVSDVATVDPVTTVTITAIFPGVANHLASQISAPPSCTSTAVVTAPGFRIRSGSGFATGVGYQLSGRVGQVSDAQTASGTGFTLKAKLINF